MIEKKIKNCLSKIFPHQKINSISKLKLGSFKDWDSLAHLNLLLNIEKKFQFKFTMSQMYKIKSIKEIIKVIKSKKYSQ